MTEQERVALAIFEAMGQAITHGDMAAFGAYLADDVELTFYGTTKAAGTFRGKDRVLRWFAGTRRFFPKGVQFTVRNVLVGASAVAVEWTDQAETFDGRAYENCGVSLFELRGDKVSAYREYIDTERVKALF